LSNTKYLNAPGTALHDTEIWVSETAVAVTFAGASMFCSLDDRWSPAHALNPDSAVTTTHDRTSDFIDMVSPR
jgi:hypothetical protein